MTIKPMLAQAGNLKDLSKKDWIYEPKLDGTRGVYYYSRTNSKMINRRDKNILNRYPEFNDFKINADSCILDGEVIVYNKEGNPDFNLLQTRENLTKDFMIKLRSTELPATYVVFDIISKNGKDLTNLALSERKKILAATVTDGKHLEKIISTTQGRALWTQVKKRALEGVMAKNQSSVYEPGVRSESWLKIKYWKSLDCIIIGYTSEIRNVSAIATAAYLNDKLTFTGLVGTGFSNEFLTGLLTKMNKLKTKNPAVESSNEYIHWIKPEIVCEIKYLELSKNHIMRAPVFLRLRNDKPIKECTI